MSGDQQRAPTLRTTGALDPLQDLYIERRADIDLLELMVRHEYCNILTSRQVGKSSLIYRAATALKARGHRVAILDIAGMLGSPKDADEWYLGFLKEVVRQLRASIDLTQWWARSVEPTPNQKLLRFFSELADLIAAPISIFVDEIDQTLKFAYTDDFFTAIRSMYNSRSIEPRYQRLTFCLVGVATPNELIKNSRTTPYNVGPTIEVADFDPLRDNLTQLYQAVSENTELGEKLVGAVLTWTGGHPHLTMRLCESVASTARDSAAVDRLVEGQYSSLEAVRNDVHFEQITRFLQERVKDGAAALTLYERICRGVITRDETTTAHSFLKLSGLVKRDRAGHLIVRNRLYARIFSLAWVRASKPLEARRRLWRVAVGASIAAVVLAAALLYNTVIIAPARAAYVTLQRADNEQQALAAFRQLTAEGSGWLTKWLPTGYGWGAAGELRDFWERRAAKLDERAKQRLAAGNLDEACILAAAAAVKRNGPILSEVMGAYTDRALQGLRTTLHPVGAPGDKSALKYGFAPDGRTVLLNWGGSFGPNLLVVADSTTGGRSWEHSSNSAAFFLGRGDLFAEQNDEKVIVRERDTLRQVPGPAREVNETSSLDDTLGYFAAFSSYRVRVWDLESRRELLNVGRPFVIAGIHVAYSKQLLAIEGPEQLEVWRIGEQKPIATIDVRGPAVSSSLVTFSSDGARIARFVTTRSYEGTRIDVWTIDGRRVLDGAALPGMLEAAFFLPRSPLLVAQWIDRATGRRGGAIFDPSRPPKEMMLDGRVQGVADDGRSVATYQGDRLHIWTRGAEKYRVVATIPVEKAWTPTEVKFDPVDNRLLFKDNNGLVRMWDWSANALPASESEPTSPADRWQQWQSKFGLTLNDADDVVPLTFRPGTTIPHFRVLAGLGTGPLP